MFLVTGATGNAGREVAAALVAAGAEVRGLVRDDAADLPEGVTAVRGDLNDPSSLAAALAGCQGVFLLPGYADMPGLMAAATSAGVRRVVQLTGSSAGVHAPGNAIASYMAASEDAVRASELDWTILRPVAFASNALRWRDQIAAGDIVTAPFAEHRAAVLHPADIGEVAAIALVDGRYAGEILPLTGPQAMTPAEQVAALAGVLERTLVFRPQPDDEARASMERAMPVAYVDAFFDFYTGGTIDESPVLPTVLEVTGHPARTFQDWAHQHADAFR